MAIALSIVVLVLTMVFLGRLHVHRTRLAVPRETVALFTFWIVSYVIWLLAFSIYRYLLPLEMLTGVIILAGLVELARPQAMPILVAAAAIACWIAEKPLEWGHAPFSARYIDVSAPPIAPDAVALIVGDAPVSYIIPFLNPHIRWLSLRNNFLAPQQSNLLVKRERDVIAAHSGSIVVLEAGSSPQEVTATLAAYGLTEDTESCGTVSSNLGAETYRLCPAHRGQS